MAAASRRSSTRAAWSTTAGRPAAPARLRHESLPQLVGPRPEAGEPGRWLVRRGVDRLPRQRRQCRAAAELRRAAGRAVLAQSLGARHAVRVVQRRRTRLWKGIAALIGAATLARPHERRSIERVTARPVTTERPRGLPAREHRSAEVRGRVPSLRLRPRRPVAGARRLAARRSRPRRRRELAGRFWDSPDLWVRNSDDGGLAHQNPEFGQDNWLYARVRNRSATATARHLDGHASTSRTSRAASSPIRPIPAGGHRRGRVRPRPRRDTHRQGTLAARRGAADGHPSVPAGGGVHALRRAGRRQACVGAEQPGAEEPHDRRPATQPLVRCCPSWRCRSSPASRATSPSSWCDRRSGRISKPRWCCPKAAMVPGTRPLAAAAGWRVRWREG